MRVGRILALEAIRRQIATDLHDDVGSGLSQIAILTEVAKRDGSPKRAELLDEVANQARSMRETMADIVWAVDPRKDQVGDLVRRLRHVAFNLLEADGLRVEFQAPEQETIERVALGPDRRRQLLLIFKEAIANIARHASARHVRVEISLDGSALSLLIQDDGCGFDPRVETGGHGLKNLRDRSSALGGDLTIDSAPGRGTTIRLRVPH